VHECRPDSAFRSANDTRPERRLAAAAAERLGVFSLDELRDIGLTPQAVLRRERRGSLVRIYPGVYALGWRPVTPEARWLAAVKACGPRTVLSHRAAAAFWGMLERADRVLEVTVPGPGTRSIPGVIVHRSRLLQPDQTTVERSVPVTTPARTVADLAAVMRGQSLRQAVRRAQGHGLVSVPELLTTLDQLGRRRRGAARLRGILLAGPAATRTVLEDVVLDLLISGGFERPDVNKPLTLSGRLVIPDFRWPRHRLVLEADGGSWHDQPVAREDDAERQRLLEAHGERVIRVTWDQAVHRREETLVRVGAAGAPRTSVG